MAKRKAAVAEVVHRRTDLTCLHCKHFSIDNGSPGYSEYTPGSDPSIDCAKGHWGAELTNQSADEYRFMMAQAVTCKDFAPASFYKEIG